MDQAFESVYPVYILSSVVSDILHQCQRAVPNETLGRLLGYRLRYKEVHYVKVIDSIGGTLEASHSHARFTPEGTRESELFSDERYGTDTKRPKEVGLFHSHPFGVEPHFSSTDDETFLTFPYNREGNVFILVDPLVSYFKVFIISQESKKTLQQVKWICYSPSVLSEAKDEGKSYEA
jgi:proteasome lid subunit RPN8/RPN11